MTRDEAIQQLARDQRVTPEVAEQRIAATQKQLEQITDDYTPEDLYRMARDFFFKE